MSVVGDVKITQLFRYRQMLTGIQCDKNIYDGRRSTTQPMEMSSLLAGPGNTTPGTGTLSSGSSRTSNNRIPQFTTNNVVLLQELGEGAFGKDRTVSAVEI